MITFSILIPTLNEEHYVGLLLDDLTKQSYKNFEVIVVNGNSVDATCDVVSGFKDRLNLRLLQADCTGASYQRNYAAKHAKYEHLAFLDADVRIAPTFFEDLAKQLSVSDFDAATCWNIPISDKSLDKLLYGFFNIFFLKLFWDVVSPVAIGTFMYVKKTAFVEVGGFDKDFIFGEDSEFFERLSSAGFSLCALQTPKVYFSVRRLEREGRLNTFLKGARFTLHSFLNRSATLPSDFTHEFGMHSTPLPKDSSSFDKIKHRAHPRVGFYLTLTAGVVAAVGAAYIARKGVSKLKSTSKK